MTAQPPHLMASLLPSLTQTVNYILSQQFSNGCIPWFRGHFADPWDHVEAAMGLTLGGEWQAAEKAYEWLANEQLPDGSWWAEYTYTPTTSASTTSTPVEDKSPQRIDSLTKQANRERLRETNFVAYIATGVWHHFLVTRDQQFLQRLFPVVRRALDCVLRYQAPTGEIYWAFDQDGHPNKDALVTASSSIYKSLACGIRIARELHQLPSHWLGAYQQLGSTLKRKPERFDRTWESKARFSMDWFYPILSGALSQHEAQNRLESRWETFVEKGLGCRCVSDEPWVTIAESCELTLALLSAGQYHKAEQLFEWLQQFKDPKDGAYWTGYVFPDKALWPEEKTTWTSAAILLAADALTGASPASRLFTHHRLFEK